VITPIPILVPLLGAVLMLLLPDDERLVRYAALAVAAVPLLLVTYIYFAYGDELGAASLTQDLGAVVRAPQSGRIRMYVTILMACIAVGLTGAILYALS